MSGNAANVAGALSGRNARPGPDAHGGDATTLTSAGFPQPTIYGQAETRAKAGNSRWTADAIRALGAITDLQTLASIFGCSVWMSRKMARTGEWERQGIKIIRIGVHYRIGVGSILGVLGFSTGDLRAPRTALADGLDQAGGNATDSAVTQAPESAAAGGGR